MSPRNPPQAQKPQQMALQIFEELGMNDQLPIKDAQRDIGYNKSQILVDVADLGLLSRRALNGCYFIAAGSPKRKDGTYDVDLSYFKWLISYGGSNNHAHLRKALREAQKSSVQVNIIDADNPNRDKWISVPMMGTVGIGGGRIVFKLPEELLPQIEDPESFTYLSLRIQATFTSNYALTMYEKLSLLKGEGEAWEAETPWMSIEEFRDWIKVSAKSSTDFRYLRRDVIQPSLDQINENSDIRADLETRSVKGSRRIGALRFKVYPNPDGKMAKRAGDVLRDSVIYEVLTKEFRLSPENLDEITENRENWDDNRINQAIEYTRHQIEEKKSGPEKHRIRWPGLYLMKALKLGLALTGHETNAADPAAEQAYQETLKASSDNEKKRFDISTDATLKAYLKLDEGRQNELWNAFKKLPIAKIASKSTSLANRDEALKNDAVRGGFAGFVQPHLGK